MKIEEWKQRIEALRVEATKLREAEERFNAIERLESITLDAEPRIIVNGISIFMTRDEFESFRKDRIARIKAEIEAL